MSDSVQERIAYALEALVMVLLTKAAHPAELAKHMYMITNGTDSLRSILQRGGK